MDQVLDWIKCSICLSSSTNKFSNTNETSNGALMKFVAPDSRIFKQVFFFFFFFFTFGAVFCSICCEMFQEVCPQCIMSMTSTGFIRVTQGPGGNMWPRSLVVFTCKGLLPPSESGSLLWMPWAFGAPAPADWNNRVKKKKKREEGRKEGARENQMTEANALYCERFLFSLIYSRNICYDLIW